MTNHGVASVKYLSHLFILLLVVPSYFPTRVTAAELAEAATAEDNQALNEEELGSLQSTFTELSSLAPKLRVLLRTLRQRVGFDPREVHKIERALGQSQQDLERMIAMHQRKAFNKMRAHFMADDLRRKSEGLKDSLGYVKRRIRELDAVVDERPVDAELRQSDDNLVELLGLYSNLVGESVMLLKDNGMI